MIVHHVGNKANGEGVGFSEKSIMLDDIEDDIKHLLTKSFDLDDLYHFYFESTVELNPIYSFVKGIFTDKTTFLQQSKHIAKILYECSIHPRIKSGELSVIQLQGCEIDDGIYDAVAIIKSETPQELLQISRDRYGITAIKATGISLSKIEKGCLIFNKDAEKGYNMSIIDKTGRNGDTKYWRDNFLHVKSFNSAHHQTRNLLDACTNFINTEIFANEKLNRIEKAMISVRAKQVLKDNETLTIEEYASEVFENKNIARKFNVYIEQVGMSDQIQPNGNINIEHKAISNVKTKVDTIKLDNHFDIRIYGGEQFVIRGYDEDAGMNFYKLYFEEEK